MYKAFKSEYHFFKLRYRYESDITGDMIVENDGHGVLMFEVF